MTAMNIEGVRQLLQSFPNLKSVLVTSGSPCVGFSSAKTNARGTFDKASCLIACMPAFLAILKASLPSSVITFYLFENVIMDANDLVQRCVPLIDQAFNCKSTIVDSKIVSGTSRPRRYWSNLAFNLPSPVKVDASRVLAAGWRPLWEFPAGQPRPDVHFGTFTRGFDVGLPEEVLPEFKSFPRYPLHSYHDRLMVYLPTASSDDLAKIADWIKSSIRIKTADIRDVGGSSGLARGRLAKFIHTQQGHKFLRPLSCVERERLMGFPDGASSLPSDKTTGDFFNLEQSRAIGNAFSVGMIRYLLMPYAHFVHNRHPASAAMPSSWSASALPDECDFAAVLRSIQPSEQGGRSR